jgi:hypothetical protein
MFGLDYVLLYMLNGLALTPFFMMGLALTPCFCVAVDDDWACTYPILHDGAGTCRCTFELSGYYQKNSQSQRGLCCAFEDYEVDGV